MATHRSNRVLTVDLKSMGGKVGVMGILLNIVRGPGTSGKNRGVKLVTTG